MSNEKNSASLWAFSRPCFVVIILIAGLCVNISCTMNPSLAGDVDPYPKPKSPFYKLVDNELPCSAIILDSDSSSIEQFAAKELAAYIKKITDADVEITQQPKDKFYPIFVGKTFAKKFNTKDLSGLGTDGFLLKSGPDGILITGNEDLGTLYGVYQFIEKHLGVRWFMPGEIGEVVPDSKTLKVGTFDETETPSFRIRWVESGQWSLRQKMNCRVEVDKKSVGINWKMNFHSLLTIIPPEKYLDEHPEWFAMIKGKRIRPRKHERRKHKRNSKQLCTSNPELIKEVAKNIIKLFDDDPSVDIISACPQDGGGFCECPKCRDLDEKLPPDEAWHGRYSNRLAVFNNEVAALVAEKHPDKIIKVGAYAMYVRVPKAPDYKPLPNLAVQVCHTYSCNNHRVELPTCDRNKSMFTEELLKWSKLTNHLFIYEYYNKGAWDNFPYCQIHMIREDIPYYHKIGAEAFYTQADRSNWPSCGLNYYIAAKLVWNDKLSVDCLLNDFYQKFYGSAAEPMRQYYERLERAFKEADTCLSPFELEWATFAAFHFFTPEVLADLNNAVTKAEQIAQTDVVRKRVALIRTRVDLTCKFMDYMRAIRAPFEGIDLNDSQAVAAAHEKAKAIGQPLSDELIKFCRKNNLRVDARGRFLRAHNSLKFIVKKPQPPILF